MHKLITFFFNKLNDIGNFLSIVCAFFIMTIVLYWIETVLEVKWAWLNFIKPTLDSILNFSQYLIPLKLHALVESFNAKFIAAIAIFFALIVIVKYAVEKLDSLRIVYEKMHSSYKLSAEKSFNNKLASHVEKESKKISKFMVLINTSINKKYNYALNKINIEEQNQQMNDFVQEKTNNQHQIFNNGSLYYFEDFDKIDDVLEVLFKLIKAVSPLDYKICIQLGDDTAQIKKLAELNNIGKITTGADAVLRYKYNKRKKYGTQCIGVYQKENGTLEVHEFYELG